jgi:hypothetical protein
MTRTTPLPLHPRMCQHELREHPHAPDAGRRMVLGGLDGSPVVTLDRSSGSTSARALTDISLSSYKPFYRTTSLKPVSFFANLQASSIQESRNARRHGVDSLDFAMPDVGAFEAS